MDIYYKLYGGYSMTAQDRVTLISDLAKKQRRVLVSELSEICNVTEETIRKDLNKLESAGLITRVHGGAVLNEETMGESKLTNPGTGGVHFDQRRFTNHEEKENIALKTREMIRDGNTLFVDASTTVAEAVKAFPELMDLTIVTNSTYIFSECGNSNMNIISTGGEFNQKYRSLQGIVTKECIQKYSVDIALISCNALDMDRGVQDSNEEEAEIKKLMISQSRKVILLADHTKFDRTAFVTLMDPDKIDCLITDCDPGEKWKVFCKDQDIQLIY